MKTIVAPSLLSADFANLEQEIRKVTDAGADWLHVDVMDGHFVKNLTIGPPVVAAIKRVSRIPLDVHLMIEEPENLIADFVKAGADHVTIHVESTKDPKTVLKQIRRLGAKPGITLRPNTPVDRIQEFLTEVDLVLIMTVEPGFGGQEFIESQIEKIKFVSHHVSRSVHIEVDGGINPETAKRCVQAGANALVAGNYIFKNDYRKAIESLRA